MPLALLNLFANADTKKFYQSASSLDQNLIQFLQGESPSVAFTLLSPNVGGNILAAPWANVNPAQYSLKLGLFLASTGGQLAFQDTFTDDPANALKYATLVYDSAAIGTALGANSSINCVFEAEIKDAAGNPSKIQQSAALVKQYITSAAVTVPAGEVGATQAWVKALFFPKDGTPAQNQVNQFIIPSQPSGIPILCYFDDAGRLHTEPQG